MISDLFPLNPGRHERIIRWERLNKDLISAQLEGDSEEVIRLHAEMARTELEAQLDAIRDRMDLLTEITENPSMLRAAQERGDLPEVARLLQAIGDSEAASLVATAGELQRVRAEGVHRASFTEFHRRLDAYLGKVAA